MSYKVFSLNPQFVELKKKVIELKASIAKLQGATAQNKANHELNNVLAQLKQTPKKGKQKYEITKIKKTREQRLKDEKVVFAVEKDDIEIYNPITFNYLKNNARNRKRVQAGVKKYNDAIDAKLEEIEEGRELAKTVKNTNMNMSVLPGDMKPMKKGKYIVSITLMFKVYDKNGDEINTKTRDISREVELFRPYTRYQIADNICWNELQLKDKGKNRDKEIVYNKDTDRVTIYESSFGDIQYKNLKIEPYHENSLIKILMRGQNLGYSLLKDTAIINERVPGLCVPEFLYYECQHQKYLTTLKLQDIIDELDRIKEFIFSEDKMKLTEPVNMEEFHNRQGYDARMIIAWAQEHKYVSVHVLDPLFKEFLSHVCSRPRMTLCFLINNDHCYPIVNPEIKKDIFNMHRVDMNKIKFRITDYEDGHLLTKRDFEKIIKRYEDKEFQKTHEKRTIFDYTHNTPLVFVQMDSLKVLVAQLIKETGKIDGCITMAGDSSNTIITGYKHPETGTVFLASPDCSDIMDTCGVLCV